MVTVLLASLSLSPLLLLCVFFPVVCFWRLIRYAVNVLLLYQGGSVDRQGLDNCQGEVLAFKDCPSHPVEPATHTAVLTGLCLETSPWSGSPPLAPGPGSRHAEDQIEDPSSQHSEPVGLTGAKGVGFMQQESKAGSQSRRR